MKIKYTFGLVSLLLTLICHSQIPTIRINEFSNGPRGTREWVELAVVSQNAYPPVPGTCFNFPLNISGWVLDDNNSDFTPNNKYKGSGITKGFIRFKNVAPWNNLPLGALIVIYNAADKDRILPADDPLDNNRNGVYIVPSTHSSLEYCTTAPAILSCNSVSTYNNCSGFQTGLWKDAIELDNDGDGIQIRDASLNLIHGVVYGKTTNERGCDGVYDMIGLANAPFVNNLSGKDVSYHYNGTTFDGYNLSTNWVRQNADNATPGAFNTTNNQALISSIRNGCIFIDQPLLLTIPDLMTTPHVRLPFKVAQNHTSLIFTTSSPYMLTFRVYNLNGVLIAMSKVPLVKSYEYKLNGKAPYIVNVTAENSTGHIHNHSFKITY